MKPVNISNFKLGIDNRSAETNIPKGCARDISNVMTTNAGGIRRRDGTTLLAAGAGAYGLWSPRNQAFALYAVQDKLKRIDIDAQGNPAFSTVQTGLAQTGAISYCELANQIFFTNGQDLQVYSPTGVTQVGVENPPGSPVLAAGLGSFQPGMYNCAYSFLDAQGMESAVSPSTPITLTVSGGIVFTLPRASTNVQQIRLYMTPINGDVLYLMAQVPNGLISYTLGDGTPGKQASTQYLTRMPAGSIVRMYKGRLITVAGDTLWFSEPYNYGLTSLRHNFIRFGGTVEMVEVVEAGVFVGANDRVYLLAGTGPTDFTQSIVSTNMPFFGTSCLINAANLPKELVGDSDAPEVLWLGALGYSVGFVSGSVKDIQEDRILLPDYDSGSTITYIKNGISQALSVVHSTQSNLDLTAFDSIN